MDKHQPINLIEVKKTKQVPVFSKIKMIDGKVVGLLEGYKELPVELLPAEGEVN
ncbi:hypothetical protein ACFSMW_06850 [Virgibacillus halophilus]|uniref:Uncharacterized protein n=1 Tax=Tigheibacillus halophilus TaxID=361280 RepID=A0ABU5C6C0_9BACI|nr:hypothetical protein [Virgibacillus halophilus]